MSRFYLFGKLVIAGMVLLVFTSCGNGRYSGELIGARYSKGWQDSKPLGMSYIRGGSFIMGADADELDLASFERGRTVEVLPFWMDETEITNSEYKQFVNWVLEYIARSRLADPEIGARDEFYVGSKRGQFDEDDDEMPKELDWKQKIPWENKDGDEDVSLALNDLYYKGEDIIKDAKELNTSKLIYKYRWVDYGMAAKRENRFNVSRLAFEKSLKEMSEGADSAEYMVRKDTAYFNEDGSLNNVSYYAPLRSRSSFIMTRMVNIFPDTMCWMRDYSDTHNEPLMHTYFTHSVYAEYPVVGVNWDQAVAFSHWRTELLRDAHKQNRGILGRKSGGAEGASPYRLPTETEWEYAARGGNALAVYPWGGNYTRNANGCFLANFKPMRGRYSLDGYAVTARVGSYPANDFGLYDMVGNVAEWTSTAYTEVALDLIHDLNPSYQYDAKFSDPDNMKRKVIRGGSWKDVHYFLRCGTRSFEYQTESRSYIGFRCVRGYIGKIKE